METTETYRERQETELETLKAIYLAELRDLREEDSREVSCPPEIVITLYPQQGEGTHDQEIHTQIDLHVTCVGTYPEDVPIIELERSKGISLENVALLQGKLESLASKLRGQVMIFELAQHVKEFLFEFCKPGFKSFYDEMTNRLEQQSLQQMQLKKLKEDEMKQAIQEQIRKKTEALEEGKGRRRRNRGNSEEKGFENNLIMGENHLHPGKNGERSRSCSFVRASSFPNQRHNTVSEGNDDFCDHHGTRIIEFNTHGERQVQRGKCMSHNQKGSIIYPALDIITGECMAIVEWTVKCQNTHSLEESSKNFSAFDEKTEDISCSEFSNYLKQVAIIDQEFSFLLKLKHPNLVHYLNMKYTEEKDCIIINILQEFIVGVNLAVYLTENLSVNTDVLRHYAIGILNALDYLHQNNVVHKDLRDTSVFIDKSGIVRLGDYSLDKRLSTICHSSGVEKPENIFPPSFGRGGKKSDIHRFGILLLSLIKGCIITDSDPEISTSIQADLRDFLLKCLIKEERQRWSAKELLEHSFLKHPIEKGINPKSNGLKNEKRQDSVSDNEERDVDIPLYLPANTKGPSRIHNDFEIIELLGEGAFGDVHKAKNKLDGRLYAIKRIQLNPRNKQLNKKIMREVKLLSRLNHENVVRYYNSWIECAILDSNTESGGSTPFSDTKSESEMVRSQVNTISGNEDKHPKIIVEQASSVDWNTSFSSCETQDLPEMEDEESDDEDDDDWIGFLSRADISESIVILEEGSVLKCGDKSGSNNEKDGSDTKTEKSSTTDQESSIGGKEVQFLCIQMEFCEKSTLRTAIDGGLHEDGIRVWRLFRELVEGLDHIHQQGMIHRDLKPVNIFLDSNDHVKIGDFGLATTNIKTRSGTLANEQLLESIDLRSSDNRSYLKYFGDGSMTGEVGTALYAAPELSVIGGKAMYTQKVDIYSLGIIFFEMCYHPLMTGMERAKVLMSLRLREIVMPEDFCEKDMPQQFHIIRWLLNHDPNKRPTSLELLQSHYVPLQREEAKLQEMVRHTLLNPQTKAYKYLVDSCFNQGVTPAEDVTYDMSLHPPNLGSLSPAHKYLLQEAVKERIVTVFRLHGAICVPTPLLLPSSASHRSSGAQSNAVNKKKNRRSPPDPSQGNASYVRLMTRSGGIVSLPHDLRMSFARYVAWNGISLLKRYSVDRVYREKRPYGFHPRELYECAFDIVTPDSGYPWAEAEILSVSWEVVSEFPAPRESNYCIQLSHTSLLRAILLHCGIEEGKHQDIYRILWEARDEKYTKFQVQTQLMSLNLSEKVTTDLLSLVEVEAPLPKMMSGAFKGVTRRKSEAAVLAQQAFHELETIIEHAEALGVKCPIVIAPGLVYNVHQYSGMMCQMVCEMKMKRRKGSLNIIAAGGRYDSLLASYRQVLHLTGMTSHESSQCAVGISLSLERILSALQHEETEADSSWNGSMRKLSPLDAVVCSMGQVVTSTMARIVHDLWSAGIRTSPMDSLQKIEDVQDYCRELDIPHIIILKDADTGTVRVSSWEKDRYNERKVSVCDLVEHMQRAVKVSLSGDNILGCDTNMLSGMSAGLSGRSRDRSCGDASPSYSVPSGVSMAPLSPSISSSSCASASLSSSRSRISCHFIALKSDLTSYNKRRYENMMLKDIEPILFRYSPSVRLEILGVELDESVIRIVISLLNIDGDKNTYEKSVSTVIKRLPDHRKYLTELCEVIHNLKFEKNSAVLILYSLMDNFSKPL